MKRRDFVSTNLLALASGTLATGDADASAKGQRQGDPWQLAADIVLGLSLDGRRAA